MNIWQAILLGAVQGFAEFLPISSSGHLLLIQRWLKVNVDGGLFFDVMLHMGTLIPVCLVFFKEIKGLFKKPYDKLLYIIIATVPAGITGCLLQDKIEGVVNGGALTSAVLLAITFVLTALELFFSERLVKKQTEVLPLSIKSSIVMGVFQAVAIVPGLSRSGTVLTGGAVAKLDRNENAEFTFLMSIPIILGAALVSGFKAIKGGAEIEVIPIVFGVTTAAVTGYIAIKAMLSAIKKAKYKWFSLYLLLIAAASVLSKIIFNV